MKRIGVQPRDNWPAIVESQGMAYHTLAVDEGVDPKYWDESHAYELTSDEVDAIEEASQVLYRMCLSAVEYVIGENKLNQLAIPPEFHDLVKKSWDRQDVDLYGRFDLAFDENGIPKMLEYNADTPTSLLESSVIQWYWLEDYAKRTGKNLDQFNSIHENLIEVFKDLGSKLLGPNETFFFTAIEESVEDVGNTRYLQDVAIQAGLKTEFIPIHQIGWNGVNFTDLNEKPINTVFKLYPWEWLIREEFGQHMTKEPWDVVEPAWKLVLSNKGILPILWEMFPDHPNLLPAYWNHSKLGLTYVSKPLLSREGADIRVYKEGKLANDVLEKGYGEEGFIYQKYLPLQKYDGMTPIIGSWIIGGRPCGVGIREDVNEVTANTSRYVPHYFVS